MADTTKDFEHIINESIARVVSKNTDKSLGIAADQIVENLAGVRTDANGMQTLADVPQDNPIRVRISEYGFHQDRVELVIGYANDERVSNYVLDPKEAEYVGIQLLCAAGRKNVLDENRELLNRNDELEEIIEQKLAEFEAKTKEFQKEIRERDARISFANAEITTLRRNAPNLSELLQVFSKLLDAVNKPY